MDSLTMDRDQERTTKGGLRAPTVEYLEGLDKELTPQYADQDRQIDDLRAIRSLQKPVAIPDDYKLVDIEIRDATITDEIMRLVAMLTVNEPKLTVDPRPRRGDRAERNATLREQFTEEMFKQAGSKLPGHNTHEEVVDAVCGDGGGWTKFVFDKDIWRDRYSLRLKRYLDAEVKRVEHEEPDEDDVDLEDDSPEARFDRDTEEAKKEAGIPFRWSLVDSRTIKPVWRNGRLAEMLEIQDRPVSEVFRQYRLGLAKGGDLVADEMAEPVSPSEKKQTEQQRCQVWQHWDEMWATIAVRHSTKLKIVQQWRHGFGRVPYFFAPGYMMSFWRNRKVGWGVSYSKRWLVEYRAFLWTLHAQIAARDARPVLFSELSDAALPTVGDPNAPKQKEIWTPGEIIQGIPGQKMAPIPMPNMANSLREQISLISEQIQNLESPRVKGPLGGGMEGAGFAISQLLTEAKTKDHPLVAHIQQMYDELTGFAWWLIKHKVKEKVWVWRDGEKGGWLGLGPDDLKDAVGYKWRLDPERPSSQMIVARYWHERLQAGTADWASAVSALGDNPDEVRLGQAADRLRNSEWYQKLIEKEVAERSGRGDAIADAQAQEAAATGLPPGMAGPQMGGPGDQAALAMAPGGAGAAPQTAAAAGIAPANGAVTGVGPGAVIPQQAAAATVQNLGT